MNRSRMLQRVLQVGGINYALDFDGIDDYVNIGTLGSFGSDLATPTKFEFDIKTTSTDFGFIFGGQDSSIGQQRIDIAINIPSGGLYFYSDDASSNLFSGNAPAGINDGNWHFCEIIINVGAGTIDIIVDGTPITVTVNNNQNPNDFRDNANPYGLGARVRNGTAVELADVTLGNFKIIQNYDQPTEFVRAFWEMNEGSGCTTADSSGNGNTGTLEPNCPTNSPIWTPL